jgi:hypothetical protein
MLRKYFKRHRPFMKADESLVCGDNTWDRFFKPALLGSKTDRTCEFSVDE